ncbi:MAG: hypothetical protein ACERK1_13625, partial [Anaerolineales bacterium]
RARLTIVSEPLFSMTALSAPDEEFVGQHADKMRSRKIGEREKSTLKECEKRIPGIIRGLGAFPKLILKISG